MTQQNFEVKGNNENLDKDTNGENGKHNDSNHDTNNKNNVEAHSQVVPKNQDNQDQDDGFGKSPGNAQPSQTANGHQADDSDIGDNPEKNPSPLSIPQLPQSPANVAVNNTAASQSTTPPPYSEFTQKLVLKKLKMATENRLAEALNLAILQKYSKPGFGFNHHHIDTIENVIKSGKKTPQDLANEIRTNLTAEIEPNGTLALILRHLDAQISAPQASQFASEKTLGEQAFFAAVAKLNITNYTNLSADEIARKMIDAYITPTSFLTRIFSNRHHRDWLSGLTFADKSAQECHDMIVGKITTDNIDLDGQGTLAMMLNAFKQLADYGIPKQSEQPEVNMSQRVG